MRAIPWRVGVEHRTRDPPSSFSQVTDSCGKQAAFVEVVLIGGVSKCGLTGCLVTSLRKIRRLRR